MDKRLALFGVATSALLTAFASPSRADDMADLVKAAIEGLPPVTLLALLKHPLLRLGAPIGTHVRAIAALERAVLRGPRPRRGTDGLGNALAAFREELAKFRRGERCDLHPADPPSMMPVLDDSSAAVQCRLGSIAMASAALSSRMPSTPLASARPLISASFSFSASLVAAISLPQLRCGTPCSWQYA